MAGICVRIRQGEYCRSSAKINECLLCVYGFVWLDGCHCGGSCCRPRRHRVPSAAGRRRRCRSARAIGTLRPAPVSHRWIQASSRRCSAAQHASVPAERGDRLRKLGATHVLDRAGEGGEDAPPGYDVIIDIVAGADMPAFFARLNPNGRMVVVGIVAGYPPADFGMTMMAAFQKSLSFATFSTDTVPEPDRRAVRTEQFEAASRGELQMVVHELLPLEQAVLAHQKMDAGEVFGRIVLVPSGS
jgi:hypothetical protein